MKFASPYDMHQRIKKRLAKAAKDAGDKNLEKLASSPFDFSLTKGIIDSPLYDVIIKRFFQGFRQGTAIAFNLLRFQMDEEEFEHVISRCLLDLSFSANQNTVYWNTELCKHFRGYGLQVLEALDTFEQIDETVVTNFCQPKVFEAINTWHNPWDSDSEEIVGSLGFISVYTSDFSLGYEAVGQSAEIVTGCYNRWKRREDKNQALYELENVAFYAGDRAQGVLIKAKELKTRFNLD